MKKILYTAALLFFLASCNNQSEQIADTIIINGNIATMDSTTQGATAIAMKDGKILAVGSDEDIKAYIGDETEQIDAQGNFVMPGFIEGHGHYQGLGSSMIKLNLMKTKNWNEIVQMVAEKAKTAKPGEWIVGRGWHQEKWNEKLDQQVYGYPYHDDLSAVSPDNPVMLRHASGHSLFANKKAMEISGVTKETGDPMGGLIVKKPNDEPVGVFEEKAMGLIMEAHQEYLDGLDQDELAAEWLRELRAAEKDCLRKGVTSFQDAGSSYTDIERYKKLAREDSLNVRLWVMLRHPYERMKDNMQGFPIINEGDDFFTCRAIKSQVDGALGAYGAWLLKPYNDKPEFYGQNTTTIEEVTNVAGLCTKYDMQLCVHAIGDRANREVLDIFENEYKKDAKRDWRWRIEHAQHINMEDIPRFAELGVIASMQGVHCTSDAPFVPKRLGEMRARLEAYAWRQIIDSGALIANGTDAPVEDVDPIASFYASVTRNVPRMNHQPFFPEQKMTREEALASYTINNAYAAFEEDLKGSISVGKLADVVILSNDLLKCKDEEIMETEVLYTIVGGEVKFKNE
jgi:predicted amidohydrolase YtcJ